MLGPFSVLVYNLYMAEYIKKYNPTRSAEWNYGGAKWKLSRSKIDFFFECPRCFYLDNKLGTKRPGFPSFNLNIAVDELFIFHLFAPIAANAIRQNIFAICIPRWWRLNL